ncbi:MAG: YceI family protein [Acidobacteriaceae bacterium]|nr:YceI family protein [Acidobacteriaceae bacterium]
MRERVRWLRAIYLTVLSVLLTLPPLRSEQLRATLDPPKTIVLFTLSDVLHTVHGSFQLIEGHVSFDSATGAITGDLVVNAASGNSGSAARDKRMKRNILETERYPEIRFRPTRFAGSVSAPGTSNVEVTGSFLIHGQAHEITIPMQIQLSREEITATGKFIVPYVQWGMRNPSTFLLKVNDRVQIDFTAVGRVNGAHTP